MDDLIYNQAQIPKELYRYGLRSSAATGCGWIATYNALRLLGGKTDIEALIRYFEWQTPLLNGNAGTALWTPVVCFRKWGYPVKVIADRKKYDVEAKAADVCILFYHWRQGVKLGAHFVALRHTENGFVGYNTYRNSNGPDFYGESLEEFIRKRKYFGTALIAIRKKECV